MQLDVVIDGKTHRIEIPPDMLVEAEAFFGRMDQDMDNGWQMGPEYVERPDTTQRCQIAASKLLTSHAARNTLVMQLMAAYILKQMPAVRRVDIDTGGEMLNTRFQYGDTQDAPPEPAPTVRPLDADAARARADRDVSPVYPVGKSWRFAVYDQAARRWVESPFTDNETDARRMRDLAHARLVEKLQSV